MDVNKKYSMVAMQGPTDKFFHKPGVVAYIGVPWVPMLGGWHVRQTLQTGFLFYWCKTKWSKIAYFCYEAHQRKTYDGCLRAQRQIISYTWGCGIYRGPLGASAG